MRCQCCDETAELKYLTPEQQNSVKEDLKKRTSESLLQMQHSFEEGGLKTCVALIKEELRQRHAQ